MLNPLAPERAGCAVRRDLEMKRLVEAGTLLLRSPSRQNLLVVQALVNVCAGARLTESVRDMQGKHNRWTVEEIDEHSVLVWVDQGRPKDDLIGVQAQLRPKVVRVPRAWLAADPRRIEMREGEQTMTWRMAGSMLRAVGGVTVARRWVAAETRKLAESRGCTDAEAMARVRDVLGHAPNSASTARYLPRRLGSGAVRTLRAIAMKRGWSVADV